MTGEQLGLVLQEGETPTTPKPVRRASTDRLIEVRRELTGNLPTSEDLIFNHAGLCQVSLPHVCPADNATVWTRRSGRFTLMIRPGVISSANIEPLTSPRGKVTPGQEPYIGVPYGSKARLIIFHLQTEGIKSRTVSLGKNLSSYLRSLGLEVRGGSRGTIRPIREQALRIGRCTFTMQWDREGGGSTIIHDTNIVEGMELWNASSDEWAGEVQLSAQFCDHLREHAVPLDKRGIALLKANSLGLDFYALLAHRLQRLNKPLELSWDQLYRQMGNTSGVREFARAVRGIIPALHEAYPAARFEIVEGSGRSGSKFVMYPSPAPVPKSQVQGFTLLTQP